MTRAERQGHTLFEILLALGLSLVLLVAVYSALDMHWKYSAAGREQMERLQLTRALFERLRFDIRNIRDVAVREPLAGRAAVGAPPSRLEAGAENASESPAADVLPPLALAGDADRLLLRVSRPRNERSAASDTAPVAGRGPGRELRYVTWALAGDPAMAVAGSRHRSDRRSTATTTAPSGGLARWEANRVAAPGTDGGAAQPAESGVGGVLADEVTTIRFRYYDGSAWYDAWDNRAMSGLPRAVEVTIGFRPLATRAVDAGGGQLQDRYRVVIAVPLSEPGPAG